VHNPQHLTSSLSEHHKVSTVIKEELALNFLPVDFLLNCVMKSSNGIYDSKFLPSFLDCVLQSLKHDQNRQKELEEMGCTWDDISNKLIASAKDWYNDKLLDNDTDSEDEMAEQAKVKEKEIEIRKGKGKQKNYEKVKAKEKEKAHNQFNSGHSNNQTKSSGGGGRDGDDSDDDMEFFEI